jgi:branched-chain amino acid aminotransferase
MINLNGSLVPDPETGLHDNRAFLYGDAIFETVRILDGRVLFLEDHYFRLMAAMRIVRMAIPMAFTMEYVEEQLLAPARALGIAAAARARLTVYRNPGGFYRPATREVSFLATASALDTPLYPVYRDTYEADLFRDFYIPRQLLSTLKSTNRLVNITGSIFAEENGLDNCLLLNDAKNVAEALNGNLFLLQGKKLVTPPLSEGPLNGIMRKQVLELARTLEGVEVEEAVISPFDLQKADELFITNVIQGIRPITKYRKKEFGTAFAAPLAVKLNAKIRLG